MSKTVVFNLQANTKEAEKNIKNVAKEVENTNKATLQLESTFDKATGGLVSKTKGAIGTVQNLGKGFLSAGANAVKMGNLVKVALASTGIGILLVAFGSLLTFFTKTQRGADQVKQAFAGIQAAVSAVVDRVSNLGEAFTKLFSGDFRGALETAKQSFKGLGDEIRSEVAAAAGLEKALQKIKDREIDLIVSNAELRKAIAADKLLAEDRNKTFEERLSALDRVLAAEDKLLQQSLEIAREEAKISKEQVALGESSRAEIEANALLQAKVIDLEAQSLTRQKEAFTRRQGLLQEANAAQEAIRKENQDKIDKETEENQKKEDDRLKAIETLNQEYKKKAEDLDAETQVQKVQLEEQRTLAELERLGATEQQKFDIIKFYDELKTEAKKADREKEIAEDKKQNEEKDKIRQEDLDKELAKLEAEKTIQSAKFGVLNQFGLFLKEIAGDSKELQIAAVIAQQAAAIGQIVSNTGIANAKAVAASPLSFGQPWVGINSVSAGLGIATSVAAGIKSIQQIKSSNTSSSAPSASPLPRGASGGASTPPSFNVIGSSPESQLAQAIGGQSRQPVKAYVVAGEVTTAQSLERNTIKEASI